MREPTQEEVDLLQQRTSELTDKLRADGYPLEGICAAYLFEMIKCAYHEEVKDKPDVEQLVGWVRGAHRLVTMTLEQLLQQDGQTAELDDPKLT